MNILAKTLAIVLIISPLYANAITVSGQSGLEVEVESDSKATIQSETEARAQSGDGNASAGVDVELNVGARGTGTDEYMEMEINGDPDFDLFVEQVETNNADVTAVRAESEGAVEVEYKHTGRLLWIFPVTVTSKTTVDADEDGAARVKVAMPWWSFLVTGIGNVRGLVESRVAAAGDVSAAVSADASASARAHLIETIVSSLKATASAEANASAGGN